MKRHNRRDKKGKFAQLDRVDPVSRAIQILWLAFFWCAMIILMERVKWMAAKDVFSTTLLLAGFWSGVIIIAEVFKYTAAKRLYRLFPWLNNLVNMEKRK